MKEWINKHPWMTFFLALGALGTVEVVARGYAKPPPPPPHPLDPFIPNQTQLTGVFDDVPLDIQERELPGYDGYGTEA